MATNPDPALKLTTSEGVTRTLDDWSTMFHLCLVILPARPEAAKYVPIGDRFFGIIGDSDARASFVVAGPESVARRILGTETKRNVVFIDPDLELVNSLGLERLPAFVLLRHDGAVVAAAEGWDPKEWNDVAREVGRMLAWTRLEIALPGDPPAFPGWPVSP
jgi:hypothetical protein